MKATIETRGTSEVWFNTIMALLMESQEGRPVVKDPSALLDRLSKQPMSKVRITLEEVKD
jgi:hypothetical protein